MAYYQLIKYCQEGNLNGTKKLIEENPDLDIHWNNEEAFREVCLNGHLKVAQWLVNQFPDINYHAENGGAFRWACIYGPERASELARAKNI